MGLGRVETNPDWEFTSATDDTPASLDALWDTTVERLRLRLTEAIADGGLDQQVAWGCDAAISVSLRRLVGDLIEEYGRHTGHVDLLREAADGLTGEDPPWPVDADTTTRHPRHRTSRIS